MRRSAALLFLLLLCERGVTAPCCGAGARIPGFPLAEERTRATVSSRSANFRGAPELGSVQVFAVEASTLFSDRWSLGARSGVDLDAGRGRAGPEDVAATIAFEAMPEWDRSVPFRGVLFLTGTVPVRPPEHVDLRAPLRSSRGVFLGTFGFAMTRSLGSFDVWAAPQLAFGHPRADSVADNSLSIPGPESSMGLSAGVGWHFSPLRTRLGVRAEPSMSWRKRTERDTGRSEWARRSAWNTGIDLAVAVAERMSVTASYDDNGFLSRPEGLPVQSVVVGLVVRTLR